MQVKTYIFLAGCCEKALNFYRDTLGAEILMMLRFKESPDPTMCPPGGEEKVMHATFRIGETTLQASDGCCKEKPSLQGFSLSIGVPDEKQAEELFTALGEGGQIQMPLTKTFFSPKFGMVADRFGVSWMIVVEE